MQRDEALARLRSMETYGHGDTDVARWAIDRIATLEAIPNQIDGLATCAEASGATPDATLLLKLAAAEQRIAELEAKLKRAEGPPVWDISGTALGEKFQEHIGAGKFVIRAMRLQAMTRWFQGFECEPIWTDQWSKARIFDSKEEAEEAVCMIGDGYVLPAVGLRGEAN
jgi:hypothetical protein